MSDYTLSRRARGDLQDIWQYTRDNWSRDQADKYLSDLDRAMRTLASDPERGRDCSELRRGYRRYAVAAHVVFFRDRGDMIEIVRVLHNRMDFRRHL